MSEYIRRFAAPLALGLALVAGACSDEGDGDALGQDSSLSRDLALAGGDSLAQPTLTDTFETAPPAATPAPSDPAPAAPRPSTTRPSTTRPSAPRPAPTRPAPAPNRPSTTPSAPTTTPGGNTARPGTGTAERATGSIAAGTTLALNSASRVCTNTHKVGDTFTATVAQAVTGSNGATIPAGATATLRITEVKNSENANDPIRMSVDVVSVSFGGRTYALDARTTGADVDRVRVASRESDAKKVIGGAIIGAIAGQVLGKDTKGTVIGAATGAAAGTAAAAATGDYAGCIASGNRITVVLNDAVTMPVAG